MKVISKINLHNRLTQGKSYEVINKSTTLLTDGRNIFYIFDDGGFKVWYLEENFLSLQELRELNIDNLLQND